MGSLLAQQAWDVPISSDLMSVGFHPPQAQTSAFLHRPDSQGVGSAHSFHSSDGSGASSESLPPTSTQQFIKAPAAAEQRAQEQKEKNRRVQKQFRARAKEREQALEQRTKILKGQLDRLEREKVAAEAHVQLLSRMMSGSLAQQNSKAQAAPYIPADAFEYASPFEGDADLVLKSVFDCPVRLTSAQVQGMRQEYHWQLHRALITKAKHLLSQCTEALSERQVSSAAGKELEAIVNERQGITAYIAGRHPLAFQKMLSNMREGQPSDAFFWHRVLGDLQLTHEQQRFLSSELRTYITKLKQLLKERQRLQNMLATMEVGPVTSSSAASQDQIAWGQILQALRDNCDAEYLLCSSMCISITYSPLRKNEQALTVFQRAQLFVSSYPYQPEMLNLLALLDGGIANIAHMAEGGYTPSRMLPDPSVDPYVPLQEKLHSALFDARLSLTTVC